MQIEMVPEIHWGSSEFSIGHLDLAQTSKWLQCVCGPRSRVTLDADAGGKPEGIVIRTPDRKVIAKLRLEDYARAFIRSILTQGKK
jgi:hypothetical protein